MYNNGGTISLTGCILTNNTVINQFGDSYARGGAIFNNGGAVTLTGTSISNNAAIGGVRFGTANGGAIYTTNGSLTLVGCALSGNTCDSHYTSPAAGGAVCIASGTANFTNCLFNTNGAVGAVIGVDLVPIPGIGGAIALLGGTMTVNQCLFLNNRAKGGVATGYAGWARGGAIYSTATASIAKSSFLNNSAPGTASKVAQNDQGGAIYNSGTMQLNGCCLSSNFVSGTAAVMSGIGISAGGDALGAGAFNAGQLRMTNCTITMNTAQGGVAFSFGAFPQEPNGAAIGAGICNTTNAIAILMNVTLASNLCTGFNPISNTNGFSAGDQIANTNGTLRLHNTLLAYAGTNGNAYGPITDDGYNISSDGSAAFASGTSYNSTDPKLGPLADNGGPTLTMAPLALSPAIDFGDANGAPDSDQRGFLRPFGAGVDIGAVEYGSSGGLVGITLTVAAQGSGSVIRNPSNSSYPSNATVTVTAVPTVGWYFSNWSGDTNGSVNPLNVVMNSSLVITGNFLAYPTYPLTLATNGQGTIVLSPVGNTYFSNTVVTATATPAAGWLFTGWTGSAAGSTNPLAFTMNSAQSLTANFVQLPAFDVPPVGVTNSPGSTVSFFAHAVGTAPLAYQWYFNNALLAGATNTTLAYLNVSLAQAGSYRVVATNNYGSVTSSVALLVLTNGSTNPLNVCDEPSLRAAIARGGWISIGCNGTITLTDTITIANNVILDASGVNATISGGNAVRLFKVQSGASLTITNLTLANGLVTNSVSGTNLVDGGAIYNSGTLNLIGCQLLNNKAYDAFSSDSLQIFDPARGGAVFNNGGTAMLLGTVLSNNIATGNTTGFGTGTGYGGAIYTTNGSLTLINCSLSSNSCLSCYREAEGGAICVMAGSVVFSNCQFNANNASCNGVGNSVGVTGGAIAQLGGNLTMVQSQFLNNRVLSLGSIYLGAFGGGAYFCAGTATVLNSSFLGNAIPEASARAKHNGNGGAIYNTGSMTLNGCCLASNLVWGLDGSLKSLAAGDGLGGGIYNAGQLKMTNCTLALNMAHGGVLYGAPQGTAPTGPNGNAIGAGLYNESNGISVLMNVTLANNTSATTNPYSTSGFSAGDQVANLGGTVRLHNTLLAYAGTNGNAYGTITDDGYNMSSDSSAALFASGTSYNFTDPKLGPLADNGGPTLTMAPLAISPAIDFGDANGAPHSDQRGLLRPFGDGVDIGAVEYGSIYPAPSPVKLLFSHGGPNLLLNFTATPTIFYHLQSSTNLTSWIEVETIGAFSSPSNISRTITPQGSAKIFYRVWYQ